MSKNDILALRMDNSDLRELNAARKREIDHLNDELATLRAALQAQSEEIARLRKELAGLGDYAYGMINYANAYPVNGDEFEALLARIREIFEPQDSTEKDGE